MKAFIDNNFCLTNKTAQHLYHTYAESMPIIDYHCHLNPKDIAENKTFTNLADLWLSGDHYKWRIMRADGVCEDFITGDKDPCEKLRYFARVLEKAIGNPIYHWCHMELNKYFDYKGILKESTVDEVITHCEPYFKSGQISARKLIEKSNVTCICTTDDPVDDLRWHKQIAADKTFKTKVYPSFRPDRILNIEKNGFTDYIKALSAASAVDINSLAGLKKAIQNRIEYFSQVGCRVSDHGLDTTFYAFASDDEVEEIFASALSGKSISPEDALKYKSAILLFLAGEYKNRNWIMQLHYGCSRNVNTPLFDRLGADTGLDCINPSSPSRNLAQMLDAFSSHDALPKTIVYSLDPSENTAIDTITASFQGLGKGHIQHGCAWWFNDHKKGMEEHMESLASNGVFGNFIGMLTDSRSFVSYTRHDYFRRILCNLLGKWVEDGEYPYHEDSLSKIIKGICYNNALEYFGF